MGNMSYCRFQNTLSDLEDCYENMESLNELDEPVDQLGYNDQKEIESRKALVELCKDIVDDYYEDITGKEL